jgi:signal transduction histidine kinase
MQAGVSAVSQPTVTGVTASSGQAAGGDSVTISGTNFAAGASVRFGNNPASGVTVVNSTTITATTPASEAATVDVMVVNSDHGFGTLSGGYTYQGTAPTVSSVAPTYGSLAGGNNVTINGSDFVPSNSIQTTWSSNTGKTLPSNLAYSSTAVIGNTVYLFGGSTGSFANATNAIYSAPVSDPTTWTNTGKTLPGNLLNSNLAVIGDMIYLFGGFNGSAATGVIYSAPVSDPTTWTNTDKTLPAGLHSATLAIVGSSVYIFGGADSSNYAMNVIYSAPLSDPTTWSNTGATLPDPLGYSSLVKVGTKLYLLGGSNNNGANPTAKIYSADVSTPTSWSYTGKSIPAGLYEAAAVTVGDYVYFVGGWNAASAVNTMYKAPVSDPTSWSATGVTLPAGVSSAPIAVVNGNMYLLGGYTSGARNTVYSLPVNHNRPNQYNDPWITNWATTTQSDQTGVSFGGVAATNVSITGTTTMTATTPAHAAGAVNVTATNYNGQSGTSTNAFTYMGAPTITSIDQGTGSVSGGDSVTITGTNFAPGATVKFGANTASGVTVVNDTTITATVPASSEAATVDITVINTNDDIGRLAAGYAYLGTAPTISGISPIVGDPAGGTNVTVTGSGFVPPNSTSNSWSSTGSNLPAGIEFGSTAVIGNTIYLFGGSTSNDVHAPVNTIYSAPVSNPTSWTLVSGKTLPGVRAAASIAVVGNKIYMFGGFSSYLTPTNTIYSANLSDPTTWTDTGKTLPAARGYMTLVTANNALYLYGGYNGGSTNTIYTAPLSNPTNWSNTGKTLPSNLELALPAVVGNNIYLYGGYTSGAANVIYTASTSDPATVTNTGSTLPGAMYANNIFAVGSKLYMVGGHNGANYLPYIYSADVSAPTNWTYTGLNLPAALYGAQYYMVNNKMYIAGGETTGASMQTAIYSAAVTHNRPNYYLPPWQTNWVTSVDTTDQTALTLGGTAATSVSVNSSTQITATTAAHSEGTVDVVAKNYNGQAATLSNGFNYTTGPAVTSITPNSGSAAGGDSVTITGANFFSGATVSFGGATASNVTVVNSTTITATTPAAEPGTYEVVVTNTDTQSGVLASGYTYSSLTPSVTAVSPTSGPSSGGTAVTISGTNLPTWAHRRLLTIDKSKVSGSLTDFPVAVTITDPTLKTAANGGYVGKSNGGDIKFVLPDGTKLNHEIESYNASTGALVAWVKFPALSNAANTPFYIYYGNSGASDQWNASGTWGSNYSGVWHLGETSGNVADSTSNGNTGVNNGSTTVAGKIGNARTFGGGTSIDAGNSASLNPSSKVTLMYWMKPSATGQNANPVGKWTTGSGSNNAYSSGLGQDVGNNYFSAALEQSNGTVVIGSQASQTYSAGAWQLMTVVADGSNLRMYYNGTQVGTAPTYNGTLKTNSTTDFMIGRLRKDDTLYSFSGAIDEVKVLNNSVSSGWVATAYANQNNPSAFYTVGNDQAMATVTFGGTPATGVIGSGSTLTAIAPAHSVGATDVTVSTYDAQTGTLTNGYTYASPVSVTSVAPGSGSSGGGDSVTITGAGFASGATVTFGGTPATGVTVVNSTTITATTPAHAAGQVDVVVTNADTSSATLTNGYNFNPPPGITAVTPNTGDIAGGTSVTITGTDFQLPTDVAAIANGGTASANSNMPDTLNYAFDGDESTSWGNAWYAGGTTDPWVASTFNQAYSIDHIAWKGCILFGGGNWNPPGRIYLHQGGSWVQYTGYPSAATYAGDFFLPTPQTADGIMFSWPSFGSAVGCNTISAYQTMPVGSGVKFDGTSATNVQFINTTTVKATTPAHARGAVDVAVTGADGQTATSAGGFTYTDYPSLTNISPASGPTAGGTSVTLTGTNFKSGDTVTVGGVPATNVVIVNSTQITATTPANTVGPASVTVTDQDNVEATLTNGFTYNAPTPTIGSFTPTSGVVDGGTSVTISGSNYDTGYVRQVTITNTTATNYASNYPVALHLDTASLITAGKLRSDCGDLRIKASNKTSNLPYNVASGCNSADTTMWVELSALPANSSVTIYLAYGYSSLTANNQPGSITSPPDGYTPTVSLGAEQRVTSVTFGGIAATVTAISASSLTVSTPAHSAANVAVAVANFYGPSATAGTQYKYVPTAYAFTNSALTLAATQPGQLVLEARDGNGNTITAGYDITLALDSDSAGGLFATNQNGTYGINSIVLPSGQSSVSIWYKDSTEGQSTVTATGLNSIAATQEVAINSKYRLLVTGVTSPVKAGVPSSVTVQAVNYAGQPLADYTGSIHFTSTDSQALVPGDYTFTTDANGQHTFVNAVTMRTVGSWCVTATDKNDSVITGQQCSISVVAADAVTPAQLAIITSPQTFAATSASGAITIQAQGSDGTPSPVFADTKIYINSDSATGEFSTDGANWSGTTPFQVTIPAGVSSVNIFYRDTVAGSPTLTFADTDNSGTPSDLVDTSQTETVVAGPAASLDLEGSSQIVAGQWSPFSVTLKDAYGNTAQATASTSVYLSSDSASLNFAADSSGTGAASTYQANIAAGENSVVVYAASNVTGSANLTASDNATPDGAAGLDDGSLAVSVVADAAAAIVGLPTTDMNVYAERQLSFEFHDIYGNVSPLSTDKTLTYDSTSSKGQFTTSAPGWNNAPASFLVSAGTTTATIQYQDGNVGAPTVTATTTGLSQGHIDLNVLAGSLHHFGFVPSGQTIVAGQAAAYTIKAYDAWGNETSYPSDLTLNLSTSSADGEFSLASSPWNAVTQVTLTGGSSSVSLYYKDTKAGKSTVTAANAASPFQTGSDTPTITGSDPVELYISSSQQVVATNTPSAAITLGLKDQYGNPTKSVSSFSVAMSTPSPTGQFSLDGSSGWSATKNVTFGANSLNAPVYYRDSSTGIMTMNAASNDYSSASQQIQVEPGTVGQLAITANTTMTAGTVYPVTIESQTSGGVRAAVASNTSLDLTGTGQYSLSDTSWAPVTSVTLPQGQASLQLFYKPTAAGSDTLTATENPPQGWTPGQLAVTVNGGAVTGFVFSSVPSTTQATLPSDPVTVSARDIYGNITLVGSDTAVYLYSSQTEGTFALANTGPWTAGSVTIPAGNSGADFYYKTTKSGTASLTASDHTPLDSPDTDLVNAQTSMVVSPGPATNLAFTTLPQTIQVGQSSLQMKVGLQDDGGNAVTSASVRTLSLTSDCGGTFSTSPGGPGVSQLILSAGSSDVFFYFRSGSLGSCHLTVSGSGLGDATQTETITAQQPVPVSISLDTPAQNLTAGQTSDPITVSFRDAQGNVVAANTDITVGLLSSSGQGVFSPTSLTFHAGDMSASFTYRDLTPGSPVLTASSAGLTSATQTETISAGTLSKLKLSSAANNVAAGNDLTFTVQLLNQYDAPFVAVADQTVYLHSSGSGTISDNTGTIDSLVIPAGQGTGTFTYNQTAAGSVTLTASDVSTPPESPDSGLTNGIKTVTVVPSDFYRLQFVGGPSTIEAGAESSDFSVQAQDQYGNAVSLPSEGVFPISSSSGSGVITGNSVVYPGQLTIHPGDSTGTFTYRDTTIASPTLTVDGQGVLDASRQVDIVAGNATQLSFVNPPARFDRGGVSDPIVIALRNAEGVEIPATSDLTVYLNTTSGTGQYSTNINGPWDVTQVTIPSGSSRVTVYYRDDSVSPPATLTASDVSTPPESPDSGLANAVTTIANDATDPAQFVLSPSGQTIIANHPSAQITVSTIDYHGNPSTPLSDQRVYLRSTSSAGEFSQDGVTWGLNYVTIPANTASTTFYYRDKTDGTPTITASDAVPSTPDTGILNASQQLTIQRQVMDHFLVANISDPQDAGNPSSAVVSAVDADGYVIEWYDGKITFSSDDPTAVLPPAYTFRPAVDKGIHTFVNGVAFQTPGIKAVTVTDTQGKTGTQYDIHVNGATVGAVEQLAFISPSPPLDLTAGQPSGVITLQLQDSSGNPVAAGIGGYPVRLTSSSGGGEFAATLNGPWKTTLDLNVPYGLTFVNLYYRDSSVGSFTLTGADWLNRTDSPAVTNATLAGSTSVNNDFEIHPSTHIMSRNALGDMVPGSWFFGHTADGQVNGSAQFDLTSKEVISGDLRPVDWSLAWRSGSTVLSTASYGGAATVNYNPGAVNSVAGAEDFVLEAVARDEASDAANSKTISVPVSPWRTQLSYAYDKNTSSAGFTVKAVNNDTAADPAGLRVRLLNSDHSETGRQYNLPGLKKTASGTYQAAFSTAGLPAGKYVIHGELLDGSGNILADAASEQFDLASSSSGDGSGNTGGTGTSGGNAPGSPASPPAGGSSGQTKPNDGNSGGISGSARTTGSSNQESGVVATAKKLARSKAAPVVITAALYSGVTFVAVLFVKQIYNEMRRIHRLLAALRRERQTSIDKTAFLRLVAHFLRTPITGIKGAAEFLKSQAASSAIGEAITQSAAGLSRETELVIEQASADTALNDIAEPDVGEAEFKAYASPFFWMPVILSIAFTLLSNRFLQSLGNNHINGSLVAVQMAAGAAVAAFLYFALRGHFRKKEEAAQLQEMLERQAELDEAKNRFIKNAYETLETDVMRIAEQENLMDDTQPMVSNIKTSTSQLQALLDKFNQISTIESARIYASEFSLSQLATEALVGAEPAVQAKNLKVVNELDDTSISQDEALLAQVLSSVFDNAVEYSPEGGTVTLSSRHSGEGLVISVRDQGPGLKVDPDELFQAFKRGDDSLDFTHNGAGLSLFLDRIIMQHLGGEIEVHNLPGGGTEAVITVPDMPAQELTFYQTAAAQS